MKTSEEIILEIERQIKRLNKREQMATSEKPREFFEFGQDILHDLLDWIKSEKENESKL